MAMNSTGGGRRPLSLLVWAVLVTVLTAAAYLTGASMARTWIAPPQLQETPAPTETPSQVVPTARLTPDDPVEGILDAESGDEWVFGGKAGQAATLEMWFHPGSGSNMEAELIIHLSGPDGTSLANEPGSMFLPPYAHEVSLPATGPYRVQVVPISGAPGRYSLLLTLSAASVPGTLGATLPPQTPQPAPSSDVTVPAQATFQWPTPRRAISGWTFHDPRNPGHIGLDIAASMWDPIVAVADGVVVFAEWGGGYGNLVIVEHGDSWHTYYAHLTEIVVEMGMAVRQGELLGGAGTTGYSTGTHLHFEIRYKGRPVDPHIYLP